MDWKDENLYLSKEEELLVHESDYFFLNSFLNLNCFGDGGGDITIDITGGSPFPNGLYELTINVTPYTVHTLPVFCIASDQKALCFCVKTTCLT